MTRDTKLRWRSHVIPFRQSSLIRRGGPVDTSIRDAIDHIQNNTSIRFVQRTSQKDYIFFNLDPRFDCCNSHLGRKGGRQFVQLGDGRSRDKTETIGLGLVVHEIGHALGLMHEHQRRDRNAFVRVNQSAIKSGKRHIFRVSPGSESFHVGEYDITSIMHYEGFEFAKLNPSSPRYRPTLVPRVSGTAMGGDVMSVPGDMHAFNKAIKGNVHITQMASDGRPVARVATYRWSSATRIRSDRTIGNGWTHARHFRVGQSWYLFLMKSGNGRVHIHRLNTSGRPGERTYRNKWSAGWTSAEFFTTNPGTVGERIFLVRMKQGNGLIKINEMDSNDGSVMDDHAFRRNWSAGWTHVKPFRVGRSPYLFMLKKDDGTVHIHPILADGTLHKKVYSDKWSKGWSSVEFYRNRGNTFLFLLKEGNGRVHMHQMTPNGTVGPKTDERRWSKGWTHAVPYSVMGSTQNFLLLLKKGSGRAHLHPLDPTGFVGPKLTEYNWSNGWSSVDFYSVGTQTFMFLLKEVYPY